MKYTITIEEAEKSMKTEGISYEEAARLDFVRATIGKDAEAVADYVEKANKKYLAEAVATCFEGDSFKWTFFIEGVKYPFIDAEAEEDSKAIKVKVLEVTDIFRKPSLKATKSPSKSTKEELPLLLFGMLNQYGHNLGVEFLKGKEGVSVKLKEKAVAELKLFTKFSDAPKVFFDNATSNKGHERQLQVFFDTFFGEGVVVATKHYVDHLKESFIVAKKDGYADKSELAFLQLICNEAYMTKHNKKYTFKSNLTCHREHKER